MKIKAKGKLSEIFLNPKDFKITEFKNCSLKDGKITTGSAFTESDTPAIRLDNSTGSEMSFMITDCRVFYGGRQGVIAQSIADNLFGNITHNIIFIAENGETEELGSISFRTNGEEFSYPSSFLFFSGKKTVGEGIYFLSRQAFEDEDFIVLREYNREDDTWVILSDAQIYAPTVFKFGRGESYHLALIGGNPLEFPSPRGDEPRNLLSSGFVSEFTTDGASYGFTLPFMKLDDELIKATLKLSSKEYTFKIFGGSIKSESVLVENEEITMYCDRSFGRVYFEKKESGAWSIPFSNEYNNLSVLAFKTEEGHKARVGAMTSAKKLSGSVITGGEAVTVFWGSDISPSSVIVNSPKNPLYFPTTGEYVLGEEREVTDILLMAQSLYVFKGNEIYKSTLKPSEDKPSYPLTFSLYATLPTAPARHTPEVFGSNIVFADSVGNVYKIKGGNTPTAEKIYSGETPFDFAATAEDKYLLVRGSTALVLQQNGDSLLFGEWNLPRKCLGIVSFFDPLFFFEKIEGHLYDIVSAKLSDSTVDGRSGIGLSLLEDMTAVKLVSITLYGEKGDFALNLNGVRRRGRLKDNGERLLIGGLYENPNIRLCFKGGFSLEKIKLEYKKKG